VYNSVQNYNWYTFLANYYLSAYALDSAVTATGGAYTGGTLNPGTYWSGVIATLKASSYYTYTLHLHYYQPQRDSGRAGGGQLHAGL